MSGTTQTSLHRYQRWSGRGGRPAATGGWLNIASTGVRWEYKRPATRNMVLVGLVFVCGACPLFYVLSLAEALAGTPQAQGIYDVLSTFLGVDLRGVARIGEFREVLWRSVFIVMIKWQLLWALIVVARVGPGLIANDLKARALPIYFARPVTPLTYVLGKWMVAAAFIGFVVLVPNLLSLLLGVLITGGLHTWGQTLGLGLDLVICGLGVMVLGGIVVLALSSLTSDSRYVTVGWLAVCLLPVMAQSIIHESVDSVHTTGLLGSMSLQDDIVILTEWLFDMRGAWAATPLPAEAFERALSRPVEPMYPALVLCAVTVVAALVCYRRVVRFSRAAANV
ncbi:MAG TPA: hypothetical protein VM243_09470 [Phycisphaerae bacterium]|nr:hypothetical protein [Phycisphaerae bacterium]